MARAPRRPRTAARAAVGTTGGFARLAAWLWLAVFGAGWVAAQDAPPAPPPQDAPADAPAEPTPEAPAETPAADAPAADAPAADADPEVPLSFANADINAIVQWLGQFTGKSVIKHKDVNCKLTVLSTQKLPLSRALPQVYRALSLEGLKVIELRDTIFIIPAALEAEIAPELLAASNGEVEPGRGIGYRSFPLRYARAQNLREKVKVVLSKIAKVEVHEPTNQLLVTDYGENLDLLGRLLEELDVATTGDTEPRLYELEHAKASILADLIQRVLSGPAGGEGAAAAPIRVVADDAQNRLVVNASEAQHLEVAKLLETLDIERPADFAVRTLELHHVKARDLMAEIAPMYEKLRGVLADSIEITAHSRSNSLIVLSKLEAFEQLRDLVAQLDTAEAQQRTTRVFKVENADAEDLARQLEDLFQQQDDYYWYRSRSDEDDQVRFVANRRQNTVIASGDPAQLDEVAKMIETLDEPVSGEDLVPLIYQLKYVDAFDMENVLQELFNGDRNTGRRSYYDDYYYYGYSSSRSSQSGEGGRLQGKVRVTSSLYTNSLIITSNSRESLEAVRSIIDELDKPSGADSTLNLRLKHANAVTISNMLNVLFAGAGAPPRRAAPQDNNNQGAPNRGAGNSGDGPSGFELETEVEEDAYYPWLGGGGEGNRRGADGSSVTRPVSDLIGKVRVVPDSRTNSLTISTAGHFFPQVLKVVEELDVPTPQVLIEATIVEVAGDARERIGWRWSPNGEAVFDNEDLDNSFIGSANGGYSENFMASILGRGMGTGIIAGNINIDLLVQFLRRTVDGRVRASPRINVADNERGKLFVGSRVPFITGSLNTNEGGRNDSFQYRDVGIILEVTPHINRDGNVTLRVSVESSQIREGQTLFGGAIIDTRNYRTAISIATGETLLLGGIIQREQSEVERGVWLLSEIPLLGWLFKKRDTVSREVELMVFLKPVVTRTPEEVRELMREERARAPGVESWLRDLEVERLEKAAENLED